MPENIKRVNLRIPGSLHNKVTKAAANDRRSLNRWIEIAIERALAEDSSKQRAKAA